jgi:hypothetical protein
MRLRRERHPSAAAAATSENCEEVTGERSSLTEAMSINLRISAAEDKQL